MINKLYKIKIIGSKKKYYNKNTNVSIIIV